MKKEPLEQLEWFFEFVHRDLEREYDEDGAKVSVEIGLALVGTIFAPGMEDYPLSALETIGPRLTRLWSGDPPGFGVPLDEAKRLQVQLRSYLDTLKERVKSARLMAGKWMTPQEVQQLLSIADPFPIQLTVETVIDAPPHYNLDLKSERNAFLESQSLEQSRFRTLLCAENNEKALIFQFLQAVGKVGFRTLGICPECDRWFLRSTEKDKMFCSQRCASRACARNYREGIKGTDKYEAVLEKARDNAHKLYVKKVHDKTPGAVVKRRPRKTRRKEE